MRPATTSRLSSSCDAVLHSFSAAVGVPHPGSSCRSLGGSSIEAVASAAECSGSKQTYILGGVCTRVPRGEGGVVHLNAFLLLLLLLPWIPQGVLGVVLFCFCCCFSWVMVC